MVAYPWLHSATATRLGEQRNPTSELTRQMRWVFALPLSLYSSPPLPPLAPSQGYLSRHAVNSLAGDESPEQSAAGDAEKCDAWFAPVSRWFVSDVLFVAWLGGHWIKLDPDNLAFDRSAKRRLISVFPLPLPINEFIDAVSAADKLSFAGDGYSELGLRLVLNSPLFPLPSTGDGLSCLGLARPASTIRNAPARPNFRIMFLGINVC